MWGGGGAFGGEFYAALLLLFVTAVLAVLGHALFVVPGRNSPGLCVRRFMHWLGCAGYFCGGVSGMFADGWPIESRAVTGLVVGSGAGFAVGCVVWLRLRAARGEGS